MKKPKPVRVNAKLDTQTVVDILTDELMRWKGARVAEGAGAIGVVLGRILQAHVTSGRGLEVNYPGLTPKKRGRAKG